MSNLEFSQWPLSPQLLTALEKMGFKSPTQIQSEVINALLGAEKTDLVALAQTGSGKTAAFGIPLAEKLNPELNKVQALILSPTRELAAQIHEAFGKFMPAVGLRSQTVYGGQSYDQQRSNLKKSPHIIIATPGRLVDLLNQKLLDLTHLKVLVLDEADRMLSMGFEEDLQFILSATHQGGARGTSARASCQTWFFSATMAPGLKRLLNRYLSEPKMIEQVQDNQGVSSTLDHRFFAVKSGHRGEALLRIMKSVDEFYGIVFCQTKVEVAEVETLLLENQIPCMSLHGDKLQKERERILKSLKDEKFSVLIATDVAARGLDVKNLRQVVHYSLPYEIDSYVHRSGRTGRNGESGTVISILTPSDFPKLNRLVRTTGIQMQPFEAKSGKDLLKDFAKNELVKLRRVQPKDNQFKKLLEICEEALPEFDMPFTTFSEGVAAFLTLMSSESQLFSDGFWIQDFNLDPRKNKRPSSDRGFDRGHSRNSRDDRHPRGERRFSKRDRSETDRPARGTSGNRWGREDLPAATGRPPRRGDSYAPRREGGRSRFDDRPSRS